MEEISFLVEKDVDGGYIAKAVGAAIVTEADSIEQLREAVKEVVQCHYEDLVRPQIIRLNFV
jgi:predicted RNase H-like HicB family nuclease